MNGQLRIDEMFAFVILDEDGTEGIPSWDFGGGHVPLVGADMDRVESLRPFAKVIADSTGLPVRLVKFSKREELEVWQ